MIWDLTEEKAFPEKCEGQLRIRLKFAWQSVQIEQKKLWLEDYVLVEKWAHWSSDVQSGFSWFTDRKFFRWKSGEVHEFFKDLGIISEEEYDAKTKGSGTYDFIKVYNYLDQTQGPIFQRKEPQILWFQKERPVDSRAELTGPND